MITTILFIAFGSICFVVGWSLNANENLDIVYIQKISNMAYDKGFDDGMTRQKILNLTKE